MLPKQREFVKKMADERFALIGINSDRVGRSALKKRFEKEAVVWPQIIEGSKREINTKWNIMAYSTMLILDHEGVIRMRGFMSEETVDEMVENLLKKIPAKKA